MLQNGTARPSQSERDRGPFACGLCAELCAAAVTSAVCGHSFCFSCAASTTADALCPQCITKGRRVTLQSEKCVPNCSVRAIVALTSQPCPLSCGTSVALGLLASHLKAECERRPFTCPNVLCGREIAKVDMDKHVRECMAAVCRYTVSLSLSLSSSLLHLALCLPLNPTC